MTKYAFICENCRAYVQHPHDRWNISEDAVRADGKVRGYRIHIKRLCTDCVKLREQELRPDHDPNQVEMPL